ncbi:RNA-binding protein 12B-like isoform 1-T2 [Anomaloglossus baeobatrachus]|uniref:RNA-binding protein 12B-like n=1 Tax=Anomaloglossus baeobatrachus TaxID=238106 RepID=UPI003F50CA83
MWTVRLEGLPPIADAIHVRRFFVGLKIEDGDVNIIGGVHGEAYVTFKDKLDVFYALQRSRQLLMGAPINILAAPSYQSSSYLRIVFKPLNAKLSDVKSFFKDLCVENVIFLTRCKVRSGVGLVKFGKMDDAEKALSVFQSSENRNSCETQNTFSVLCMWLSRENDWLSNISKRGSPKKKNKKSSTPKPLLNHDHHLLYIHEFYARLVNVSLCADKSHIRKFLHNLVDDSQITFVYDKDGNRQRECFVMFITENDYVRALELDKAVFKGRRLRVLPISKPDMMDLIEINKNVVLGKPVSGVKKSGVKFLYLRNFAASVNKHDVLNFFTGFSLTEQDICLLYDDNGDCLGEALVKFSTKAEASKAEKLNHKKFQDTEILLRCVSKKQLKAFSVDFSTVDSTANWNVSTSGADVCVSEGDHSSEANCDAV